MNKSFKRAISSILSFVMLCSSIVIMNTGSVMAANKITRYYANSMATGSVSKDKAWTFTDDTTNDHNIMITGGGSNVEEGTYAGVAPDGVTWTKRVKPTGNSRILSMTLSEGETVDYYVTASDGGDGDKNTVYTFAGGTKSQSEATDTVTSDGLTAVKLTFTANSTGTYTLTTNSNRLIIFGIVVTTPIADTDTTDVTVTVKNTVDDAAITGFTITDSENTAVEANDDGTYPLYLNSKYTFSADGYKSECVAVNSENFSVKLTPIYNVTFTNAPEGYTVEDKSGNVITANTDGTYSLVYGVSYVVKCTGYGDFEFVCNSAQVTVDSNAQVNVTLTVTNGTDAITGFTVKDSDGNVVTGNEGVYALTPGEAYTISADKYVSATYTVAADDTAKEIELDTIYFTTSTNITMDKLAATVTTTAGTITGQKIYDGKLALVVNKNAYAVTSSVSVNDKEFSNANAIHKIKTTYSSGVPTDGYFELYLKSGSKVKVYANNHGSSSRNFVFYSVEDSSNVETVEINGSSPAYAEFEAPKDGVYYICSSNEFRFYEIDVVVANPVKVAGTVTLADDSLTMPTKITFTSGSIVVSADIVDGAYEVTLVNAKTYDVACSNNELMATTGASITANESSAVNGVQTHNVVFASAAAETVTGTVYGLDDPTQASVKFTKSGNTSTATVNADGTYSISLLPGTYTVTVSDIDGYTASTLSTGEFVVEQNANNYKNVLYTKPATALTSSDIYVSKSVTADATHFNSINDAMAAINASNLDSYTVHITPDVYEEQVVVKKNNVTFTTDNAGDATISWYYGFGYDFYSVNPTTGRYDKEYALLKVSKKDPSLSSSRWGAAVIVEGANFYAENIIFKNTHNFEVTDAEKADGVSPATNPTQGSAGADRTVEGFDPQSKSATERAAAICIDSSKTTFYKCSFLSSQDTVVTNSTAGKNYMNQCTIVGQTDYICGGGNLVVDNSSLLWKGYSDTTPAAGYITASKGNYLFRDCKVGNYTATDVNYAAGYFGRPWSAGSKVIFKDTTINDSAINYDASLVVGETKTGWFNGGINTTSSDELNYICSTDGKTDGTAKITSQYCTKADGAELTVTDLMGPTYLTDKPVNYAYGDFEDAPVISEYIFTDSTYSDAHDVSDGVLTLSGYSYNGGQHGIVAKASTTMKITVDGAKTILLGGCSYSNGTVTVTDSNGNTYTSTNTKTSACYANDTTKLVTLEYPTDTATELTLTFTGTSYIPYMKIMDYVEVAKYTVSGKIIDKDGNTLTNASVTASAGDLTVSNGTYTIANVADGTVVTISASCSGYSSASEQITVTANTTKDITLGAIAQVTLPVTYDFRSNSGFTSGTDYVDSLLTLTGYTYNGGQHGIQVKSNTVLTLAVKGSVKVTLSQCKYGSGTISVTDTAGNNIVSEESMVASNDGDSYSFEYTGNATTLTFAMTGGYVHTMTVEEVADDILYGDVDGDGSVTADDASLVKQHIAKVITLEGDFLEAADVDGNSNITADDVSLIRQFVAKAISKFPVEE